ncbi:MAG: YnbE family lipoprotein [Novosphingobium sp.]|uniref:YnbE family lipoprotein n=1 Tax=Novosphingobium sp. TaxID=1874826 RepID=UPI0017B3AF5D|nr:YnbE family lipoprotein [Novosphingobium sp.]
MISNELTNCALAARTALMQGTASGKRRSARWSTSRKGALALGVLAGGALALGGCVSVNAPDKPIVIELNINIKQEVIYRLAADAGNTITDNPDIF